ncbi:LamG-like jellyroll fold domain-containing protein [Rhodococcoides kyotonense]|uniref:Concanavalin A-like lectin/glucanases superfamily protein n=1 Tax=Rhodococcoides kyotonense TaxID=398843 RepID=A0A239FNL4_9NOCA|nr:LamG-like jellyroll fold domain-containing protein [Rhodococcus kyotonensis]SNS58447.1 Concanavalin A-like lectin/glucanases superfamily protein [Rhodococcus kyotonensis]
MLRLDGVEPSDLRVGQTPVVALAVGSVLVWQRDPGSAPVTVAAVPVIVTVKVPAPVVASGGSVTVQVAPVVASLVVPVPVPSIPRSVQAVPVSAAVVVPAPAVAVGAPSTPVTVQAVPVSASVVVPAPVVAIFPTPVSAFAFGEQSGSTAASKVGSYTLTAATPSNAWGGGAAVGPFSGALGANTTLASWSLTFDVVVTTRPTSGDFSSMVHIGFPVDYYFEINSAGIFDVFLGGATAFEAPAALVNGTKYALAVTKTGTTLVIYVNGVAVLTNTAIGSTNAANFSNVANVIADGFSGSIDNLRLFASALTAAQAANVAAVPV